MLSLAAVQVCFALYFVIQKVALDTGMGPGLFALCRDAGIFVILAVASRVRTGRFVMPPASERFEVVMLGVLGLYFGQYVAILGIKFGTPTLATLWSNLSPLATFLLGLALGAEVCTCKHLFVMKMLGLLLAVSGAMIATSGTGMDHGSSNVPLATVCFALQVFLGGAAFWHLQKRILQRGHEPLHVAVWYYGSGVVVLLLAIVPTELLSADGTRSRLKAADWLALAFGWALYPLCAFALTWANRHSSPLFVMVFAPLQLTATFLFEFLITGYTPSTVEIAGSVLIVLGIAGFAGSDGRSKAVASGPPMCDSEH